MNELEQRIEQYLTGKMKGEELITFENEISNNQSLAEKIALKQDLIDFFDKRNPELDKKLKELGAEYFGEAALKNKAPNKSSFLIITIILLLLAAFLFYYFNKNEGQSIEVNQVEEPIIINEDLDNSKIIENPIEEEKTEEQPIDLPTFNPQQKIEQPSNTEKKPIASLENYKTNQVLEDLIRENIRSNEIVFEAKKIFNEKLSKQKNGKVNMSLSGTINVDETVEIVIYDNKSSSFNQDIKTLSEEIKVVKTKENLYKISFNANMSLENGLYYYILKIKSTQEILLISKFEVR